MIFAESLSQETLGKPGPLGIRDHVPRSYSRRQRRRVGRLTAVNLFAVSLHGAHGKGCFAESSERPLGKTGHVARHPSGRHGHVAASLPRVSPKLTAKAGLPRASQSLTAKASFAESFMAALGKRVPHFSHFNAQTNFLSSHILQSTTCEHLTILPICLLFLISLYQFVGFME